MLGSMLCSAQSIRALNVVMNGSLLIWPNLDAPALCFSMTGELS